MVPEETDVLDAIIRAAELTASKASGNDQTDWNNFANALRIAKQEQEGVAQPKGR